MRSIELTFDPALEAAFRAEWAALQAAGLPNLGRHPDASNRPHLTVAAGSALEITEALTTVFDRTVFDRTVSDRTVSGRAVSGQTLSGRAGTDPLAEQPAAAESLAARPHATLPVDIRVSGLVLFRASSGRFVLARPVVMSEALMALHRAVLSQAPGAVDLTQPDRWTPHVTLSRRINAGQVADALDVLGEPPAPGRAVAARFWNGETKTLTALTAPIASTASPAPPG